MGASKSKKKEIVLIGLDGSGKTTTLQYVMQGDAAVTAPSNASAGTSNVDSELSAAAGSGGETNSSKHTVVAPTVGYAEEHLRKHFAVDLVIRDFGGSKKYRNLWETQYNSVHGIVFVLDAADEDRFQEAKEVFQKLVGDSALRSRSKKIVLLVISNKSDLPQAIDTSSVTEILDIDSDAMANFDYHVARCSALKGTGVPQAFAWLTDRLSK